jgi:hypothetical protein
MSTARENIIDPKYIPLDDYSAKLEIFVQMDEEQYEGIGAMDEAIMTMAALQHLYMVAVMNTSAEKVNTLLEGTRAALEAELESQGADS